MTRDNDRTALVTGGHGFLGSHLVDLLLEDGFAVRCLLRPGRDESVFRGRPVEIARGDLRHDAGLVEAARGVDCVFHVAGLVAARGPEEFDAVNVEGTRRIARVAAAEGCERFIYVSSQAAAGPSDDGRPVTEDCPPRPLTHYGRSKLEGERAVASACGDGTAWAIVRPPAIYGPGDDATLPIFRLASRGWAPGLEGRGRRFNLLHARDVATAVLAAARIPASAGRIYFVADANGYGYDDLAGALGRAFGRRLRRIPIPDLALNLAAILTDAMAWLSGRTPVFGREKVKELKARWWLCSAARAERELGWKPTIPLDEGVVETVRWYANTGRVRVPPGVTSSL